MSVYKRGPVYYYEFTVEGRRYGPKSTRCAKKAEALVCESQAKAEALQERTTQDRGTLPLSQAIERMWTEKWEGTPAGNTTRRRLEKVVATYGDQNLSEITPAWLNSVRVGLAREGLGPNTINQYLKHIGTLRTHARTHWDVATTINPIQITKVENARLCVIDKTMENRIVSFLRAQPAKSTYGDIADLVEVLAGTGARMTEILTIEYASGVDWDQHCIQLYPENTKAGQARNIPMLARVEEILKERQQGNSMAFPLTIWQVQSALRFLRNNLPELPKEFCFHSLRHSFASRLISKGVDIYTISKLLGHRSVKTTEQYYLHLSTATLAQAIAVLD